MDRPAAVLVLEDGRTMHGDAYGAIGTTFGEAVFATGEEAELMEVPMTTPGGTGDAERLGVEPLPVREVLRRA